VKKSHVVLALIVFIAAGAFITPAIDLPWADFLNWGVLAAILALLVCVALFFEFETTATSSKEIALVAMLGTISAVLRVPFAAIPNVQPTVGAMTALVSNFFLGHGPWTLYQMIAWGLAGLSAGYLSKLRLNSPSLISLGIFWNTVWFDTLHAIGNAIFLGFLGRRTVMVLHRFKERFSITFIQ